MHPHLTLNRVCRQCGTPFHAYPSQASKFCRLTCWYDYQNTTRAERFWLRVTKTDGCWECAGSRTQFGHVKFPNRRGWVHAHRFAWYLATGHWPEGDERILHTCDVPQCVRNDDAGVYEVNGGALPRFGHLFLGTDADNLADMRAKGRGQFSPAWWAGKHRDGLRGRYLPA